MTDKVITKTPVGAASVREGVAYPTASPPFPADVEQVPLPLGARRVAATRLGVPCVPTFSIGARPARIITTKARRELAILVAPPDAMASHAPSPTRDAIARDHGIGVASARTGTQGYGAGLALALLGLTPRERQAALVPMGVPPRSAGARPAIPV